MKQILMIAAVMCGALTMARGEGGWFYTDDATYPWVWVNNMQAWLYAIEHGDGITLLDPADNSLVTIGGFVDEGGSDDGSGDGSDGDDDGSSEDGSSEDGSSDDGDSDDGGAATTANYAIVDTGQTSAYDVNGNPISVSAGSSLYGQDGHYQGNQPAYRDNGDGTVTDLVTGLMWQQTPDFTRRYTLDEARELAENAVIAGYDDWRLPSIKELYSLIQFTGSSVTHTPYLDTNYFDFIWGDELDNRREIDAQYASDTEYVARTYLGDPFNGERTAFGVNFADGRIKGYPADGGPQGDPFFVRLVRGDAYGQNDFVDNGDGTITDSATGLMWMKDDSGEGMDWPSALEYAEGLELAGYSDWRLPNPKELHSILDYSRAPTADDPGSQGAAISTVFNISETESWFWTGTSFFEGRGVEAVYLAFGRAFGVFQSMSGETELRDVHGAGAQRSDPKTGDPSNYANGRGPQSDQVRIYNYVRCVRDAN